MVPQTHHKGEDERTLEGVVAGSFNVFNNDFFSFSNSTVTAMPEPATTAIGLGTLVLLFTPLRRHRA